MPFRLLLLGGIRVVAGDGRERVVASRKGRVLLARVALAGASGMARDRLAGLLWADATETRARQSLRQVLSDLRRDVGPVLIAGAGRVALDAGACTVDAAEFESLLTDAGTESLELATALYRGPLLDGHDADDADEFDDWLLAERQRFAAMNRRAFDSLIELHAAAGDHAAAGRVAERAVAFDPDDEATWLAWMRALQAVGQPMRAMQVFERCRDAMRRRLDAEPSDALQVLAAKLRDVPTPATAPTRSTPPSISPAHPTSSTSASPLTPASQPPPASLAKRPCVMVTPIACHAPVDPALAGSLAQDLIGALSRVTGFAVVDGRMLSQGDSLASDVDRARLRERGIAFLVNGRLESSGDGRYRWTIQLVGADDGQHLWAWRADLDDATPGRRDESVAMIVARLEPQLLLAQAGPPGPETRTVLGDDPWHRVRQAFAALFARGWSEAAVATAVRRYREAIDADPGLAIAHAHKALVLALAAKMGLVEADAAFAEAAEAAERAISLAPADSEVLGVAGCAIADLGDPHRGETLLERAVERNPDNPQAWAALGACRLSLARISDGLQSLERGVRLGSGDYRRTVWLTLMSRGQLYQRNFDAAIESARAAVRSDGFFYPAWLALAAAQFQAGRPALAARALAEARRIRPQLTLAEARPWISPRVAAKMADTWPTSMTPG